MEIHHELKGFTKFIFIYLNFINSKSIKCVIFISNKLSNLFKVNKKLILHDAVDIENFSNNTKVKIIKNIGYIGNFFEGRGIDTIEKLSRMNLDLNFYVIGKKKKDKKYLNKSKNFKILNFVEYKKVPKLLSKFDVLLMPYKKNTNVNSINLNTANYCSPLKMFDYLASGKVIISSKLDGINEVLKNNINSLLVDGDDVYEWNKKLQKLRKNKKLVNKISVNAIMTSRKYTWSKRIQKIIEANN